MTVKELKIGEFFTKKPLEYPKESQVFVRGAYDRASKRYECYKFEDVNSVQYLRGDKEIFVDLIF